MRDDVGNVEFWKKRLNDAIRNVDSEEELQKTYSKKIGDIFRKLEENF